MTWIQGLLEYNNHNHKNGTGKMLTHHVEQPLKSRDHGEVGRAPRNPLLLPEAAACLGRHGPLYASGAGPLCASHHEPGTHVCLSLF